MTAVVWEDKREVHMWTNIHDPSIIFNLKNLHVSGQKCPFWLPYPHRMTDRDRIRHLTFRARASYRLGRHLNTSALPQGSSVLPSSTATASAV